MMFSLASCEKETIQNSVPNTNLSEGYFQTSGNTAQTSTDKNNEITKYSGIQLNISENDPYKDIISDYYSFVLTLGRPDRALDYYQYALLDIDGNGTQELLLSRELEVIRQDEEAAATNLEKSQTYCKIYTVQDGETRLVLSEGTPFPESSPRASDLFTQFGGMTLRERAVLSNGVLRVDEGTHPDFPSYCYFKFQNGSVQYLEQLSRYGNEFIRFYDLNGEGKQEIITKNEFESRRNEIEDGAEVIIINWQPLESYGQNR